MQNQALTTARLGVIRDPKAPPHSITAEVTNVSEWHQVPLPGNVLEALRQGGAMPDPYKDFNCRQMGWVAESRFLYLIPFRAHEKTKTLQNAFLILDGVDTFARVYLNGRMILKPSNAFRRWEADISGGIKWGGDNLLIIILDPLVDAERKKRAASIFDPMDHPERLGIRRCQMSFGWDLAPPLVGPGIRGEVRIDYRGPAWIDDLWMHTIYARPEAAYMELQWKLRATAQVFEAPLRLTLKLDKNGEEEKFVVPVEKFRVSATGTGGVFYEAWGTETVTWTNPPLWFPHTHGEPHLLDLDADLRAGGVLWDRRTDRYGVRVVELEQKAAPYSRETLRFLVNGAPVFARGANWVPCDSLSFGGDTERLGHMLRKARSLGINMLRVWGGGVYESEDFYRLCDENGILVWQDFPFASGPYPVENAHFMENVKQEAVENVRRLRRHPSLAVFCGNASVQQMHRDTPEWNRSGPLECEKLFTETLPDVCEAEAPGVPYRAGCPWGGDNPNEPLIGDHHAWAWWKENHSPARIVKPVPSFLTEIGVPSAPDPRTIEQYVSQRHHYLSSGIVEQTLKDHHKRLLKRMEDEGQPPDWDLYLTRGWEMQTRVVSGVIERLRAAPDACGGVLVWTFNEAFPGFSWSMIDWEMRLKPVGFRIQQAYADILLCFVEEDHPLELHVVNDRKEPIEGLLRIGLVSLEGEKLYEKELPVQVGARAMSIPWGEALENHTHLPRHTYLVKARLEHEGGAIRAHYFPATMREMLLPKPEVLLIVRPGESETVVQLRSDKFVRWVLLQTDAPGTHSALMGFDLIPGEPVICELSPKARRARVRTLSPGLQTKTIDLTQKQSIAWNE